MLMLTIVNHWEITLMTKKNTQEKFINAALKLIAEVGINKLTMRRLAEELGLTEAAMYRHFSGKRDLLCKLIDTFDIDLAQGENQSVGFAAVEEFVRCRVNQVLSNPDFSRVLFAEELFMNDPDFSEYMRGMMHRHRNFLATHFKKAQELGEIRPNIPINTLFRLVIGPVRLLIKQWGMNGGAFDLRQESEELIGHLRSILRPEKE